MHLTAVRSAGYVIALVVALVLPLVIYPVLALNIVAWGLFAIAVDLLLGFGGLLTFGHAAFWGSAAYAASIAAMRGGLAFPVAILIGTIVAMLLSVPIGYLSIRRQGIYFAMVTLAFAQMIYFIVNQWRSVTGGENGLQGVPRTLAGLDLSNERTFYYVALPLALMGYLIAFRVVHSPFGHVLVAIRDNETRARALGYPTHRYKLIAFIISAGLAGLGGSIFALGHRLADLDYLRWTTSGLAVIMTILGGVGTLWGGVVGAVIVLLMQDWLTKRPELFGVVTGGVFAVIVLSFRRGILGTWLHWQAARQFPALRRPSAPPALPDQPATLAEPERGGTGGP